MSARFRFREFFKTAEVVDDGSFECLAGVETDKPGSLAFVENVTYLERALSNPNVSGMILTRPLYQDYGREINKPAVVVENPRLRFWALHNHLVESALIGLQIEARRGSGCSIHRSAVIGDKVVIEDRVTIGANVVIEDCSVIEEGAIVSSGAVIGAHGMQAITHPLGRLFVRHAGGVKLERHVRVLSNAIVSKAVDPAYTQIGEETVVSLLASVGHNSTIGRRCSIAGNVLIGGSVTIEDNVWIGPSVTIKDGLRIGAGARLNIGAVVIRNVARGEAVSGNFALPHVKNLQNYVKAQR
jgi:UDP-3-O-[3-hydroxymyristoyl] glucosamine N-acyltransferase